MRHLDASDTLPPVQKKAKGGLAAKWGSVGIDHVDWKVAIAHYDAERLSDAYETALDVGVGSGGHYVTWFRTIEAEYLSSERAAVQLLRQDLELEFVEEELENRFEEVRETVLSAIEEIGARFEYGHESPVRVSVLAQATDAPWLFGRYGYCILKDPYYKICVPNRLIFDRNQLFDTLRHEYAHVVVGTLSDARAPRWLDEAIAMVAEGGVSSSARRRFAVEGEEWLTHEELEADLRDLDDSEEKWLAYMQAGLVGEFLAERYGEKSLGEMLRGFSDHSYWKELWMRIRGTTSEEEAIDQVYRLSLDALFEQAHDWVRAGRRKG